jgi:aminoglycoside phosphotransferase (APT) family kinase protein
MKAAEDTAWLDRLAAVLAERGLLEATGAPAFTRLTGGVSSDIWRIEQGGRSLVVKRALEKLRVAEDWRAPVTRNAAEAQWLAVVQGILPAVVPRVLYHDEAAGLFVMDYLPPGTTPVWKARLLAGEVDPAFAEAVGRTVGRIHAATSGQPELAQRFDNAAAFHALRIAPYLEASAARHPGLAATIGAVAAATAARRDCLIHGDVSPKNILVGPEGPIVLDAECATWGDPAFDLAFCLNHLLLKGVHAGDPEPLRQSFVRLAEGYFAEAASLDGEAIEARAVALLPALFLARIDGKSPVEYITADADRDLVRGAAARVLRTPPRRLADIAEDWTRTLRSRSR